MKEIRPTVRKVKGEIVNDYLPNNNHIKDLMDFTRVNLDGLYSDFIKFVDGTPATVRTYRTSLRQWSKYVKNNNLMHPVPDDVRDYKHYLEESGKKPTTIQNYLIAVKRFFAWTEEKRIYPNIAEHVKGEKLDPNFKKDYLTSRQARKVLEDIDRSNLLGKRNYAMLILMLTMGLRTIEVSRANIEDIRTSGDATVLYVQGKGHTEKDAIVRMPSVVEDAIREYLAVRKASNLKEPLFTSTSNNNKGKRLTTRTIRGTVKRCFINAGFNSPKLTAHSTRHTTATLSLLNGATLQQTQALLRHKQMQTTEIYAHNIEASKNPASNDVANAIFN
ncbi:integrase [Lactobacillus helveticus]|nr:integrase [Lactobacillus helveticus]